MEKYQYKKLVMPTSPKRDVDEENTGKISSTPPAEYREKRNSRRKRALITGEIQFSENFANIKCVLRNLSDIGALLEVTDKNTVPNRFCLQIPMRGFEVECRIIDLNGQQIRVEFISEKRELKSKKVQYIVATSFNSGPTSSDHLNDDGSAGENEFRRSSTTAKNTNKLISKFRLRNINSS